jgi:hypothetical protein
LAHASGEICELADTPAEFASAAVHLLSDRVYAASIAVRARKKLEAERDGPVITRRLEQVYRRELSAMRPARINGAAAKREWQKDGEVHV